MTSVPKTVNKDMDDAQKAKEEAAAVKADYEHRLETSKEEAARIVADATKKAQAREDETSLPQTKKPLL